MFTATNLLYPVFLLIVFSLTVILIPREVYKKYMIYGMLVGGLGDVLSVFVYQNLLGFMWFKNQGLFYVLGQHALSPLCWTFTVMIFLYFLPAKRFFLYVHTGLGYGQCLLRLCSPECCCLILKAGFIPSPLLLLF